MRWGEGARSPPLTRPARRSYVRLHTLQLLGALLGACPSAVQGAVQHPAGLSRLVDLVAGPDVVRCEAVLLLSALCRGREEVQKLLAFEGAFERLLAIVAEEGGAEGGVAVQDCLQLTATLLRGCVPNQRLFRESGLLAQLPPLLGPPRGAALLSRQAAAIALCALDATTLLLSPAGDGAPGLLRAQTGLLAAGALPALLGLGLGGRSGFAAVRATATRCAAQLLHGCAAARDALASATLETGSGDGGEGGGGGGATPALLCALSVALRTDSGACDAERCAAEALVAAFCLGNVEGQRLLASTLSPVLGEEGPPHPLAPPPPPSFGARLAAGLLGGGEGAALSARLLAALVEDNGCVRTRLLAVPADCPGAQPQLLMPLVTYLLTQSAAEAAGATRAPGGAGGGGLHGAPSAVRLQLSLLRLLLCWLHDCPPAVAAFLGSPGNLPLLVGLARAGHPLVCGLASALLGVCLLSNDGAGGWDAHTVLDALCARLTLPAFFAAWEGLTSAPAFGRALRPPPPPAVTRASAAAALDGAPGEGEEDAGAVLVAPSLAALVVRLEPRVRLRVTDLYARPQQVPPGAGGAQAWALGEGESGSAHAARLAALLAASDGELRDQRARNAQLAHQLVAQPGAGGDAASAALDALRQQAASDLAHARAEAEEARLHAARLEEGLRSLGAAYTALEQELHAARAQRGDHQDGAGGPDEREQEMSDLLVCLGQEEAKVERLRAALAALGHDPDAVA